MGLFRRKRHRRSAHTAEVAHQPWLDHGLTSGDVVPCRGCGRQLGVTVVEQSQVLVTHDGVFDDAALICTVCGELWCANCGLKASDNGHIPKCGSCRNGIVPPMSR